MSLIVAALVLGLCIDNGLTNIGRDIAKAIRERGRP